MLRLSRICIIVLAVAVMAFHLPGLYWKGVEKKTYRPFILYSAVEDCFMFRRSAEFSQSIFADEAGVEYDRVEFEKRTPFFNYRNLSKWDLMPVEVKGEWYYEDVIRGNMQFVRVDPNDLHTPQIDLYPLFESQSMFAGLENPPDMFRITTRMEFIVAATNEVDEEKSGGFTRALQDAGFRFPARYVAGNPTTRKAFDEGYLIVDDRGTLFHVKMVEGAPWCVNTGITPEGGVRFMVLRENGRREFYGALITGDDRLHLISYDGYRLIPLPVEGYEPDRMMFQMITDPLNRTLIYKDLDEDVIHCVLTDPEYNLVRTWDCPVVRPDMRFEKRIAQLFFPFSLSQGDWKSDYVLFEFRMGEGLWWLGIVLSLIALAVIRFLRSIRPKESWVDWIVVALTGFFGLVAVLIVGREPSKS
jgi:hypothetical protein